MFISLGISTQQKGMFNSPRRNFRLTFADVLSSYIGPTARACALKLTITITRTTEIKQRCLLSNAFTSIPYFYAVLGVNNISLVF